jgi:hypothetical protein
MWKPEHTACCRPQQSSLSECFDRRRMGDVEPIIPPAKHGGHERTIDVREILNRHFLHAVMLSTGCQYQALPKTCRRRARYGLISTSGAEMARWSRGQAPPQQSSTARVPRARKKGGSLDPLGFDAA